MIATPAISARMFKGFTRFYPRRRVTAQGLTLRLP